MIIKLIIGAFIGAILNRLRGGWWHDLLGSHWYTGTHTMRAVWAIPTGALTYELAGGPLWLLPVLMVTAFVSYAFLGHGGHMVFVGRVPAGDIIQGTQTEITTSWWLPKLFGGLPDATWDTWRRWRFHMTGMGFIGLLRCSLAILPLFWFHPLQAGLYAASGALLGVVYWAGWRIGSSSQTSELLAGAYHWGMLILLFGAFK